MKLGLVETPDFEYAELRVEVNSISVDEWISYVSVQGGTHFRSTSDDYDLGIKFFSKYSHFGLWEEITVSCPSIGGTPYTIINGSVNKIRFRIYGKLYGSIGYWELHSSYIEVYDDGVLVRTWTVPTIDSSTVGKQASAVMIFGMPLDIEILPDIPVPRRTSDVLDRKEYTWDVTWGWRLHIDGADVDFPLSIYNGTAPGGTHGLPTPDYPTLTGTTTWAVNSTGAGYVDGSSGTDCDLLDQAVRCFVTPDFDYEYHRLGTDYRNRIVKFGTPQVLFYQTTAEQIDSDPIELDEDNIELIPYYPQQEVGITNAAHSIEDLLNTSTFYCVTTVRATLMHLITHMGSGSILFNDWTRTDTLELRGAEPAPIDSLGYYDSFLYPEVRYFDYILHPFQNYKIRLKDWNVQGTDLDPLVYWGKIRQAWLGDSELDPAEKTDSRNNIAIDPITADIVWHELFLGHGLRQLGLHRWNTYDITPRDSYDFTSASSGLWTGDDCSIVHGSDMTITADPGITDIVLHMELDSWTIEPFQWMNLFDEIKNKWTATGISSIEFKLVARDDEEVDITTTNDTWIDKPNGSSTKYAFSFIDNSAGVCNDLGIDQAANGISPATMADPERAKNFELASGYSYKELKVYITLTSAGGVCNVNYPSIRRTEGTTPIQQWESGLVWTVLYADNVGIRIGNNTWDNGGVYPPPTTPVTAGLGLIRNIVDFLCDTRVIFEGIDRTTNLTTQLAGLYDSNEASIWEDYITDTYGVVLPNIAWDNIPTALVNTLSEATPLIIFPRKERNTTTWVEDGSYSQHIYSWTPGRQRYVTHGSLPLVILHDNAIITSNDGTIISGWHGSSHETPVTNQEVGWPIYRNSKKYGLAVPWHGYMMVGDTTTEISEDTISYDVTNSQNHYRAFVIAGKLVFSYSDNKLNNWHDITTSIDATQVCIRVKDNISKQSVIVWVADSGTVTRYETLNDGNSFMSTTIATGNKDFPAGIITSWNSEIIYYVSGTGPYDIKGKEYDNAMNQLGSEFTILTSANSMRIAGAWSYKDRTNGVIRYVLLVASNGTITQYTGTDPRSLS